MPSPAAIGAGVGGGAVAVAGTSYAAYTQLRPYDNFLDYANRNGLVYIGENDDEITTKVKADSGDVNGNGYRKNVKDALASETGSNKPTDDEINKAGKTGDENDKDGTKLTKVLSEVKNWCKKTKLLKPTRTESQDVDWSSINTNANWDNFKKLCLKK
ncbi:hypothetical protein MHSWG343_07210 [Candidatus Mycoplasma haematohominis]|uniref:Uncharacterized protein n=1 Tax=Candidatus Mycoplasma haematohominis TaxID=1494318 RepID=A0A478FQF4_9MOLU|nr:hypothetical protein MHSWG343_07210 [Candidatus Mycoplasma haemohominis]